MASKTFEEVLDILSKWKEDGQVYKSEFDDERSYGASRVLDREIDDILSTYFYGKDVSDSEEAIRDALFMPSVMTFPTKKLQKALEQADSTPFVDAVRELVKKWMPVAEEFRYWKNNLTNGRKPNPNAKPKVDDSHERWTCPVCQGRYKLRDGKMVDHGFTLKHGYRHGKCFGVGYEPLEVSDRGARDYMKVVEADLTATQDRIYEYLDGHPPVRVEDRGLVKVINFGDKGYPRAKRYMIQRLEQVKRQIEYELERIKDVLQNPEKFTKGVDKSNRV